MSDTDSDRIVVAVDFGTTFSGVAWAQTSQPNAPYLINKWPQNESNSLGGMTSDKVPSDIAYSYDQPEPRCLWGYKIPDMMPRTQWVKLELSPEQKSKHRSCPLLSDPDSRRVPIPYHTTAEGAVTDYLQGLREHIVSHIESKVGPSFDSSSLEYVITVPAIWSDKAKTATLKCAQNAGFGDTSDIRIISEPEAAAIHALRASSPHKPQVGDTIVICDAGGGTVDLITFSITALRPHLRLKEEAPGTGALCGSTYLNKRFEEYLTDKLSSLPGWGIDTLEEATKRFEQVAKRTFTGDHHIDFMIPVPGLADNVQNGVRRSRFRITGKEMESLFLPVLQEICVLVKNQVRASRKQVSSIFLVGGFGQNPFLRRHLLQSFPDIKVFAPVDGWTAVVRGALAKTMAEISLVATQFEVESRVARKNYGMTYSTKFYSFLHDQQKRYWCDYHGEYRIQVMNWFIRKGDNIKESEPIKTSWLQYRSAENGRFGSIQNTFYELDTQDGEEAPLYFNHRMKRHANLHPKLRVIQQYAIPSRRGKDGEKYYEVSYDIHATYFSAHCEYRLFYKGEDLGHVKVDYL